MRSPAAGPLLDRPELENGFEILVPPHRLLCTDERVDREDPAWTARELDLDALGKDLVVAAHAQDLAETVQLPPAVSRYRFRNSAAVCGVSRNGGRSGGIRCTG